MRCLSSHVPATSANSSKASDARAFDLVMFSKDGDHSRPLSNDTLSAPLDTVDFRVQSNGTALKDERRSTQPLTTYENNPNKHRHHQ